MLKSFDASLPARPSTGMSHALLPHPFASAMRFPLILILSLLAAASHTSAEIVATFDDLPSPPALDQYEHLSDATGTGSLYDGVTWDVRVRVVGKDLAIAVDAPKFGIPHSGDYFITNEADDGGQGITLDTTLVLTGAWFGQNEYYGYGGGATSVTIVAMDGATELDSLSFTLPDDNVGQPEPLSFFDTSAFLSLTGITGYRIDHVAGGEFADSWVADDFTFTTVPEPAAAAAGAGLIALIACARLRARGKSRDRRVA